MTIDLDTLRRDHAGSGEQAGEPAEEAGDPNEEPAVGTKLGNPSGEFTLRGRVQVQVQAGVV